MKRFTILSALLITACVAIDSEEPEPQTKEEAADINLEKLARMFSELPLDESHLQEVYDAVGASSGRGYDEEYTMDCLVSAPGSGVGTPPGTRAGGNYVNPLRNLIRDYYSSHPVTKGPVEDLMAKLAASDYQLYWPYSENWDGVTFPIITFDPGFGAESNYGFEIRYLEDGTRVVDSVYVDERLAKKRPVWVLNSNSDAAFTPLELFDTPHFAPGPYVVPLKAEGERNVSTKPRSRKTRQLILKSFRMLRHYDSWFGGASEFWVKCGSVEGFTASTEAELKLYSPSVTDFIIVVKRKFIGKEMPFEVILVSDFTTQLDKLAFMITEDDGGTRTSWKCQALVKIQSKTYGIELDLPYNEKDDIVWRGQLSARYFEEEDVVSGRFGDVIVNFELD